MIKKATNTFTNEAFFVISNLRYARHELNDIGIPPAWISHVTDIHVSGTIDDKVWLANGEPWLHVRSCIV